LIRVLRSALDFTARTPVRLLLAVWIVAIAAYMAGPIKYDQPPRPSTWIFLGACLVAFSAGAWAANASALARRGVRHTGAGRRWSLSLDTVVRLAAFLGLFGALCIAFDKLVLSGLDFSQGVTAVRFARADAVDQGTAGALRRSPLLYLGYMTFAFSVAAYLIYLLKGETLRRSTMWVAFAGLSSIFLYSYVSGGRSPLGLVIGMAAGAILVRMLSRQSPLPAGRTGRFMFAVFLLATVAYSNWIVSERFVATSATSYAVLEKRFQDIYDASIPSSDHAAVASVAPPATPALVASATPAVVASATPAVVASATPAVVAAAPPTTPEPRPALDEQIRMQVIINSYYATHEIPMLDRTLAYTGQLGPYYGAYQFYLLAAFAQRVTPWWSVDAVMLPQLKAANVYGWFSTAWGGMYLDFGAGGALVAVLICGWLAGIVYRRALVDGDDGARLLMCYVVAGIIATPVLSIFTISISLPILVSLLVASFVISRAPGPVATPLQPRALPRGVTQPHA